jgi:hypothetical protein
MKRSWIGLIGVASAGALLLAGLNATNAGDHQDSPLVQEVDGADIYDLYAWMDTTEENTLNLIMTIRPGGFSPDLQYVFHVSSAGEPGADGTETLIMCTFDTEQRASCWVGDQAYVSGDAGDFANPLQSEDGRVRVFTGERNDPFFFNKGGFDNVVESLRAMIPNYLEGLEDDGCPDLDPTVARTLRNNLARDVGSPRATDDFAGMNATALVMQVDKDLVDPGGDLLAVWASTNRMPVGN